MKKLITSILVSLISSSSVLAQTEEDEIRLLIARAPVTQAMSKAKGLEELVIWNWLKALSYTGHTDEAFATATKIRKWMSEDQTNFAIASGLTIAGKFDEAVSLLRRAKDSSESQIFIIEILTKGGRFSEALKEARKAKNASERDNNLQTIVRELAARGEIKQALEIADGIKDGKSLSYALRHVVKGLLKAGKISEAKSLAERIQQPDDELPPLHWAIFELVSDMADDGAQENALAMVDVIENETDRSAPLSLIAESFARAGRLDEALGTARKIKDESLLSTTLTMITAANENKVASERRDGIEAADQPTVKGLLKAGKIDEALTIAQNIKDEDDRSDAFADVAEHLLRSGSYKQARLAADRCPSPVLRMEFYLEIFNELSFHRNPQLRAQIKKNHLIGVP